MKTDCPIGPAVSPELLENARELLKDKRKYNTRVLKNKLNITGVRAGAVFRKLGWLKDHEHKGCGRGVRYRRPKETTQ